MRLIVDNRSCLDSENALERVQTVIAKGLISRNGTQYCYATAFSDGVVVYTDLLKTGHKFTLLDSDYRPEEK